ncbi:hypothetical protein LTS18_015138 [Coniosporium uncinatum]|uniref:Uncharacterized protein n=1 Tax=Coniosporium uncinatum TaxID=93489 RepID=A0ACC3DG49_9PEZI|nr:hypothetical protein LTS18_015138 [Coniosporium uncinatum]
MSSPLTVLQPGLALVGWTFVMQAWMHATRLPAMSKYKVNVRPNMTKEDMNVIPPSIRWKGDNYNHLHEQPTLFYAVIGALAITSLNNKQGATLGNADLDMGLEVGLAWTYVGLRVVHSLVQSTANPIMVRFGIFLLSSASLLGMTARAMSYVF